MKAGYQGASQETEGTTRHVENVTLMMKSLQERKHKESWTTVEKQLIKLIVTEIFPSVHET